MTDQTATQYGDMFSKLANAMPDAGAIFTICKDSNPATARLKLSIYNQLILLAPFLTGAQAKSIFNYLAAKNLLSDDKTDTEGYSLQPRGRPTRYAKGAFVKTEPTRAYASAAELLSDAQDSGVNPFARSSSKIGRMAQPSTFAELMRVISCVEKQANLRLILEFLTGLRSRMPNPNRQEFKAALDSINAEALKAATADVLIACGADVKENKEKVEKIARAWALLFQDFKERGGSAADVSTIVSLIEVARVRNFEEQNYVRKLPPRAVSGNLRKFAENAYSLNLKNSGLKETLYYGLLETACTNPQGFENFVRILRDYIRSRVKRKIGGEIYAPQKFSEQREKTYLTSLIGRAGREGQPLTTYLGGEDLKQIAYYDDQEPKGNFTRHLLKTYRKQAAIGRGIDWTENKLDYSALRSISTFRNAGGSFLEPTELLTKWKDEISRATHHPQLGMQEVPKYSPSVSQVPASQILVSQAPESQVLVSQFPTSQALPSFEFQSQPPFAPLLTQAPLYIREEAPSQPRISRESRLVESKSKSKKEKRSTKAAGGKKDTATDRDFLLPKQPKEKRAIEGLAESTEVTLRPAPGTE